MSSDPRCKSFILCLFSFISCVGFCANSLLAQTGTIYTLNPNATFSKLDLSNLTLGSLTSASTSVGPFILSGDAKTFYTKGLYDVAAVDRRSGNLVRSYRLTYTGLNAGLAITLDQSKLFVPTCDYVEFLGCVSDYLEVFDVKTGQNVGIVGISGISTITASLDGEYVYLTGGPGIQVYSVANLQLVSTLFPDDSFTSLWINPDGKTAYAVSAVNISVIDLASLTIQQTISIPPYSYGTISSLSGNGATLGIYSNGPNYSSDIYFLNTATLALSSPFSFTTYPRTISLNFNGTTAFASDDFGNVYEIDVSTQSIVATSNLGNISASAVTPDGSVYVELPQSSSLEVFRQGSSVPAQLFLSGGPSVWLTVSRSGDALYEALGAGGIARVSTKTGALDYLMPGSQTSNVAIAVSPDGRTLYSEQALANLVDELVFFDAQTGVSEGSIPLPYGGNHPGYGGSAIAISAAGDLLIAMEYGPAVIVDPRTQSLVATIQGTGGTGLAISPDGVTAYISNTGYLNGSVTPAIEVVTKTVVTGSIPIPANGIVFAPDGALAYAFSYQGEMFGVAVIDTASLSVTDFIPITERSNYGGPQSLALTPDGSLLYLASPGYPDPGVIIDTQTHQIVGSFPAGPLLTIR